MSWWLVFSIPYKKPWKATLTKDRTQFHPCLAFPAYLSKYWTVSAHEIDILCIIYNIFLLKKATSSIFNWKNALFKAIYIELGLNLCYRETDSTAVGNGKREKTRYRREKGYKRGANSAAVSHNTLETWRMSQTGDGHVKENWESKSQKKREGEDFQAQVAFCLNLALNFGPEE